MIFQIYFTVLNEILLMRLHSAPEREEDATIA